MAPMKPSAAALSMARALCPDRTRASIALVALAIVLAGGSAFAQLAAIAAGAAAGFAFCRGAALPAAPSVALPVSRSEAAVAPGWLSDEAFLSGYGAAQAVPGPLFSFAAYLGSVVTIGPRGIPGAALALIAIYLPGMLLLLGTLPLWQGLRRAPHAAGLIAGVHAAVVGLLAAALYDPIWTTAVHARSDLTLAALCFVLSVAWRAPALVVVAVGATGGLMLATLGA